MLEDLNDLFGAVDGFTDDLMEYGTMAAVSVGTGALASWGTAMALNKFWPTAPPAVRTWGLPLLHVGLGALAPMALNKVGVNSRTVTSGVSIGLIGAGLTMLIRSNFPSVPLAGLGAPEDEALLGLGEDLYQKYLGEATSTIEESMNGLGASTSTIEEPMNGLANWQVENMNGIAAAFA